MPVSLCIPGNNLRPSYFTQLRYEAVVAEGTLPVNPLACLSLADDDINATEAGIEFAILMYQDKFEVDRNGWVTNSSPGL